MMVSFPGMHVRPVFVSLREVETMTYFPGGKSNRDVSLGVDKDK